jgi:signal peptidase I
VARDERRETGVGGAGRSIVREYVEAAAWALVLTFLLRGFVLQAFRIPSGSMLDTLRIGDFLFVNKFEYGPQVPFTHVRLPGLRPPRTGDIIVFRFPGDPSKDYIKRCIATGGQTIEVRDKVVYVDGRPSPAADAHVKHIDPVVSCGPQVDPFPEDTTLRTCRDNFGPYQVPRDHLFMMGDNREDSHDSRYWGTVPMDYVKGRAMFVYWSWDKDRFRPRWERLLRVIH